MVVTTNNPMTVKRMTAIANITGNVTIATSKALLIDEAIRQMQNGVCHFVFQKKDGTITERFGTLNPALCSQHIKELAKVQNFGVAHYSGMWLVVASAVFSGIISSPFYSQKSHCF